MITQFVSNKDKCPTFDVVFIDEAQDLSPIQWKMFDILNERSKDIFIAGDDDEAMFAWAGADVNRFINQPAKEEVLQQSVRIPQAVQEISNIILDRIQGDRKEKIYFPKKDKEGNMVQRKVESIFNFDNIDINNGKWLILTRTVYRALEISNQLKENNLYYKNMYGKSFNNKLYKSVLRWTSLSEGNEISWRR